MKHMFTGAAALALLTACGADTDTTDQIEVAGDAAVDSAARALDDLTNIAVRNGNASNAPEALAAMFLANSGDGRISFADSTTDGDGAVFTDVVITIPGDTDDPEDGGQARVGRLELDGLDMVDGAAVFSKLSLSDIDLIPNDPEDMENGSATIANIELLNPSPELVAWVASLAGTGEPAEFPKGEALAFDSWSLSDFNFNLDEDSDTVDFNIEGITVAGVDADAVGLTQLSNISATIIENGDAPMVFNLDQLSMTGTDMGLLNAARGSGGDSDAMTAAIMEQVYSNPMEPGYDTMTVSGLNFAGDGVNFDLPSLSLRVERDDAGKPVGYVTDPFTMRLDADAEGGDGGAELAGMLGMVGYDSVEISGQGASTYDAATDTLSMAAGSNFLSVTDGFTLSYGGEFSGYSAYSQALAGMDFAEMQSGGEPDMDAMQDALSELELSTLTLQLEDDSLTDRLFNLYAAQAGEDPDAVRQQAIAMTSMAPMMAAGAGIDAAIAAEVSTAVAAFLQSPGTLTFSLAPETPLSAETFADIQDPSAITLDMLGLEVTHTEN